MTLRFPGSLFAAILLAGFILVFASTFTVDQTQQALVIRLGQPVRVITDAGLHFKIPLLDRIVEIDRRIIDLEGPPLEVIAADQVRLVIGAFARYRIDRPLEFYQTVGSVAEANARLLAVLNAAVRRVAGAAPLIDIVRNDRSGLMARVAAQLEAGVRNFGIAVVDVRIRNVVLPEHNSQAVFQRMQTERQREAAEFRATGSERGQDTRARADRAVAIIVANAVASGETFRGEGDAQRTMIFARAFGRDAEFAAFYRSLQAYDTGIGNRVPMVLSLSSRFFDHFRNPVPRREPVRQ